MHLGIGISERNYLNLVTAVELCLLVLGATCAAVAACSAGLGGWLLLTCRPPDSAAVQPAAQQR